MEPIETKKGNDPPLEKGPGANGEDSESVGSADTDMVGKSLADDSMIATSIVKQSLTGGRSNEGLPDPV